MQDAALHDRLRSDTYRRLNLGEDTGKAAAGLLLCMQAVDSL
jgi:hypothetical protein